MYIHELYPTHIWYKNLESILAARGSLALLAFLRQNVLQIKTVWGQRPWSKRPRAHHIQAKASFWRKAASIPILPQCFRHMKCRFRHLPWSCWAKLFPSNSIVNAGNLGAINSGATHWRKDIDNLHSVKIAHRDIKPHNFCHCGLMSHCHSWEVKLIDFDAAEELKEYLLSLSNFDFESDLAF